MARDICVYRAEGIDSLANGGWRVREDAICLYDEPLGDEFAVREFWSVPAFALDLPLLASVSNYGFYHGIRWDGDALRRVPSELNRLEAHWASVPLSHDVLVDLTERAGYMRAAVAIAEECGGVVVIV